MSLNAAPDLDQIVDNSTTSARFPWTHGSKLYIGYIEVSKHKQEYILVDTRNDQEIYKAFSKASALALAKTIVYGGVQQVEHVKQLDERLAKNFTDAVFLKNAMDTTRDSTKKLVIASKFDIASERAQIAQDRLEKIAIGSTFDFTSRR